MSKLNGKIKYMLFAEGTKSECQRPYIFLENGGQILLYKKNDNPFENSGFTEFNEKTVSLEGNFENGVFYVESVEEISESENQESK